jgi:hypothetical protein
MLRVSMNCGQDQAAIPSSAAAGMAMDPELVQGQPKYGSPDKPAAQATPNP